MIHRQSNWQPEGVGGLSPIKLTEQQRQELLSFAERASDSTKRRFIEDVEARINEFRSARSFKASTTPSNVRGRLSRIKKHAAALMHEIENLDPYSRDLLRSSTNGQRYTFGDSANALADLWNHAEYALHATENYPSHRLKEPYKRELACGVKEALIRLGIEPTTAETGAFVQVLQRVLEYAGSPPKKEGAERDVKALAAFALSRD